MVEDAVIPITKPTIGEEEIAAVSEVLRSGWVSQGPEVAKFEESFADYVGAKHACAVSNCTAALHLALLALGVKTGDEVITVSHSFIATSNAILYSGATPIFVDIDPRTYNIDPALIEPAISERTRAILCVHQIGMPCDMLTILAVAKRHGIAVIEDAACAIGSEIRMSTEWERIGKPHGDIACFSFHPRKVITTGEGGMLTTNDAELDKKFRLQRQHFMSVPDTKRHSSSEVIFESYPEIGFNYRMTDLQAAVGRQQIRRLAEIVARRRDIAANYARLLSDIPGLGLPIEPDWVRSNWQSYCVRLPDHVDQKEIMQQMLDCGVATRRGIMCSHLEAAYVGGVNGPQNAFGYLPASCTGLVKSEQAHQHSIILPLYPQMTYEEQCEVVNCLRSTLESLDSNPPARVAG